MDAEPTAVETAEAGVRDGDEAAFSAFVERWYGSTVRLARTLAHDDELAHRAARDAWLLTIRELPALDRGVPLHVTVLAATIASAAAQLEAGEPQPAVDPSSFEPENSRWHGWWLDDKLPPAWPAPPSAAAIERGLERLEPAVAAVVLLRDVEGLSADDVQAALGFPADAQRSLLHQGRTAIWRTLGPKGDGR